MGLESGIEISGTSSTNKCCSTIKHNPASIRNEALPVLMRYYNQAQPSLHPKQGIYSTIVVLQPSTIQRQSETSEALPVLMQYCHTAQSNQDPKVALHNPACIRNEAVPDTIQPHPRGISSIQYECSAIKFNPSSFRNEGLPILMLYYSPAQSSLHPRKGTSSTDVVLRHFKY